MKKTGKILCLTLGTVMALGTVGLAVGCGENGGGTGKATTIVVWVPEADQEFAKQVAADFQKAYPEKNYKFSFGKQSERDAGANVLKDVTNGPDVFSFASDQIISLVQGGGLSWFVGDYENEIKTKNTADAVASATLTVDGTDRVYAFPYTDNTFTLYYNKEYFKNPEDIASLDKILEICAANKDANGKPKTFGFPIKDSWYTTAFYFGAGLDYSVTFDDSFGEAEVSCDFGNETGLKVTEALYGYTQNASFVNADDTSIASGFQTGDMIACVTGIWNKNTLENYCPTLGAAKLPTYTLDGKQVQLTAFAGYKLMGVTKYSKIQADATKFAQFYTNQANQLKHYEARGFLPTNIEAQKDPDVVADQYAAAISAQLEFSHSQKGVPSALWNAIQGLGEAMLTDGFNAETQLAAALKAIVKEAK